MNQLKTLILSPPPLCILGGENINARQIENNSHYCINSII